ncbi:MAG: FecR family protein [Rhodospirillales bacterium]
MTSDAKPIAPVSRRRLLAGGAFTLAIAGALALPTRQMAKAAETDAVGRVSGLINKAVAMQDALPRILKEGDPILEGDVLSTGTGSRLEVAMNDGGKVQLGEKAIFVVVEYVYGATNENNAVMRMLQGAFQYTSGNIAKVAENNVRIETDVATIGIRGTTVWGGALDNLFEVALIDGKAIEVTTKGGSVLLNKVGDGTKLPSADQAPGEPSSWPADKLRRAAAMTSLK